MSSKTVIHKFDVQTLSPVAIGDGGTLSPLTDFIVDNDKDDNSCFFIINQQKLREEMAKKPESIEIFNSGVFKLMKGDELLSSKDMENFLYDFIYDVLDINYDNIVIAKYDNMMPSNTELKELNTIIKNGDGSAYLPGSSIKGAIKTAILNNWLNTKKSILDDFVSECEEQHWKDAGRKYGETESRLFGKLSRYFRNDFSLIQLSDSDLINPKSIGVYYTERLRIRTTEQKARKIPVLTEAIKPNVNTTFGLRIPQSKTENIFNRDLKFFHDKTPKKLSEHLNQFSLDCIDFEIGEIDNNKADHIKEYCDNLTEIRKEIIVAQKSDNTAIIRIGSGKINFSNSIGLHIRKHYPDNFKAYSEIFKLSKRYDEIFPKTRAAEMKCFKPFGWIKLTHKQ